MVSSNEQTLIHSIKISSVGPAKVTGSDVVHVPSCIDLAMKLHYLKGVYFFRKQAVEELTIMKIKVSLFTLLTDYYVVCGRFRTSESGRPFIKCNDCGVRMIEAESDITVREWIEMGDSSAQNYLLVSQQVLGPELFFSPTVFFQLTRFKCGGMAIGLSWAHVLGDILSALGFITRWTQLISGIHPNKPIHFSKPSPKPGKIQKNQPPFPKDPLCLCRVDPVKDCWITTNNCKMVTFSFNLSPTQLSTLRLETEKPPLFESICATIWQCIAEVRNGSDPKIVTLCKNDPNHKKMDHWAVSNSQIISTIEADFSIKDADLKELAMFLVNEAVDERDQIEEIVERDNGSSDFIMYGVNLTFVDLEEADLYGLRLNGQKPEFVHYSIQGVGDEGVVMVLPGPKESGEEGGGGRFVTVILRENEVLGVKSELTDKGFIV